MPSGHKLTEQQVDRILRLAGERTASGEWLLSYRDIAQQMDLHRHTIEHVMREAAVKWGQYTAWHDPDLP